MILKGETDWIEKKRREKKRKTWNKHLNMKNLQGMQEKWLNHTWLQAF